MKINMEILNILKEVNEQCWFNEDYIISRHKSNLAIKYCPGEKIFPREFGIHSLSSFIKLLSCYKDVEIDFEKDDMIISDKNSPSCITYRTSPKHVMEDKIKSDKKSELILEACDSLIDSPDGKFIHFKMDQSLIDNIKKISGILVSKEKRAKLSFFKNVDDKDITVSLIGGDNSFRKYIKILDDSTKNGAVNSTIYIDKMISFDWDCYIFFDKTTKDKGVPIPINDMLLYLKNEKNFLKKMIPFNKKK